MEAVGKQDKEKGMLRSQPLHSWSPALWSVCSLGCHSARVVFEAPWQLHERNNMLTCSMSRSAFLEQQLQYCRASSPNSIMLWRSVCDLPPQQYPVKNKGEEREMKSIHRCWQSQKSKWLLLKGFLPFEILNDFQNCHILGFYVTANKN